MSSSSYTHEYSFTLTDAKYLMAKVSTDLRRIQRFYDEPDDRRIELYEEEITALLHNGYLDTITYGFQRDGNWIKPTIRYKSTDFSTSGLIDDDPGKVPAHFDVSGASFYSFLKKNAKWDRLSPIEKEKFRDSLAINRSFASNPGVQGSFGQDLTYSSGGQSLNRSSLK